MALPIIAAGIAVRTLAGYVGKKLVKRSLKVKPNELKSIGVRDRIIENRLPSQARANKLVKDYNKKYPTLGKVMKENLPNTEGRILSHYKNHKSFYGSKEGLPATKQSFKKDMDRVRNAGDKALINNLNKNISPSAKTWKENKIYKDIGKELNKVRMDAAKASKESVNRLVSRNEIAVKEIKNKVTIRKIKKTAPKVTGVAIGAGMATHSKNESKAAKPSYMKNAKNKEFLK